MAFKELLISYASDADKIKHRSFIDTGKYQQFSVVVRNLEEAIEVCKEFIENKKIDKVALCPGFTHADVAAISKTVGNNIGVSVSRADGPSNIISSKALKRENF